MTDKRRIICDKCKRDIIIRVNKNFELNDYLINKHRVKIMILKGKMQIICKYCKGITTIIYDILSEKKT